MKPKVRMVQLFVDRDTGKTRLSFFRQGEKLDDVSVNIYHCDRKRLQRVSKMILRLQMKHEKKLAFERLGKACEAFNERMGNR